MPPTNIGTKKAENERDYALIKTTTLAWKEILGVSVSTATTYLCPLTDSCLYSSTTLSLFRPITTGALAGNFINRRKRDNVGYYFVLCEYRHNEKSTTEIVRTFN
jgi:hypothetical protein